MKKLLTVLFACVLAFFVGCAKTRSYTVTFDGNGQTIGIAAQTVEEGGRAQEPAPPSAEGVDFGGWYENTEGLGERYDFKTAVTKDVTLYARWDAQARAVSTAEEFFAMGDGNYRLECDIDFKDKEIAPVGSLEKPFAGTLDGNGFALKNLCGQSSVFGCVTGTIKNLRAEFVGNVQSADKTVYIGDLAGFLKGGVIENCLVNAEISATSSSSRLSVYAGGIAGRSAGGEIRKCTAYAEISAQNAAEVYAGGVVGYNGGEAEIDGIVESCSHYGSVSASSQLETAAAYAGGVVGYNAGAVRDSFDVSVLVKASCGRYLAYAGGVAGDNNGGKLIRCFSAADVSCETTGGNTFLGGVTGRNFLDYEVESCYGWDGQNISLQRTGEGSETERHLRAPCQTLPAAKLNAAAWYKEWKLNGWLVEDGFLPYQQYAQPKSFARAASYGTAGNPIKIGTLQELVSMDLDKAYELTADIELGRWEPMGTYTAPFCGSLDGKGHKLYGIRPDAANGYAGVFGYLNGSVKNLKTEISYSSETRASSQIFAGGIAGYGVAAVIEGCSSEVKFEVKAKGGIAGGICGYLDGGVISECSAKGSVDVYSSNPSAYAGGVCAVNEGGKVLRCRSEADVSSRGAQGSAAGGLAAKNNGLVKDSYSIGTVAASADGGKGNVYAGGLVACNFGSLGDGYATGEVKGEKGKTSASGTVCGANYGSVENCYAAKAEGMGTLGYSPAATDTRALETDEFASLAEKLDGSLGVWKNGRNGYPVLAWQEA